LLLEFVIFLLIDGDMDLCPHSVLNVYVLGFRFIFPQQVVAKQPKKQKVKSYRNAVENTNYIEY
jgi:hypothetical protein